MDYYAKILILLCVISNADNTFAQNTRVWEKPRVIVTSDGEIDDECSMVRFLLYANEWDIEGIITSSSQYHWHGHKWADDDWLDPVPDSTYSYPEGRWYTQTAWGRKYMREEYPEHQDMMRAYFKPISRWTIALQNDFTARADWCVKSYAEANHPPIVKLTNELDMQVKPGATIRFSAKGTYNPDGDELTYKWWRYVEAGSYKGTIDIQDAGNQDASITILDDAAIGKTIHMVCEVEDKGTPQLIRYQRVVIEIE